MKITVDELKQIIKNTTQIELGADDLLADKGIDSLLFMDILLQVEERTGIRIPDEAIINLKTINDIVDYLNNN